MKTVLKYNSFHEARSDLSLAMFEPKSNLHRISLFKNVPANDRADLLNAISSPLCKDIEDLNFVVNHYIPVTGVEVSIGCK